jgi:tRNA threonylcarbamoyladenosine biosynthesis protein TsaE
MEIAYSLDTIDTVAGEILAFTKARTILFSAPMGSGKTTLIAALCKQLGVIDPVNSPTFSIVNEYKGTHCDVLHFDLYRLKSDEELIQIGFEEYLYRPNTYVFIEWPELSVNYLGDYHLICILPSENSSRKIEIS